MVDAYSRHAIRVSVAQICQIIGWTSIHSSPLEILTDILHEYIFNLSKIASNYAMLYGQTEPNLNHLALAFKDMGIIVSELEEYVTYVETSSVLEVPKYPLTKESHLNQLKPGSREVVTRPVHIHEHLPPMHPHLEDRDYALSKSPLTIDISTTDSLSPLSSPKNIFKKPGDPVCNDIRRTRPILDDNEIRPLREISSVMMTTSGFLSPAREGKLPEARTQPIEFNRNSLSPPEDSSFVEQSSELKIEKKKKNKIPDVKKLDKENKLKDENCEKNETEDELKGKKLVSTKETSKLKALKTGSQKIPQKPPSPSPAQKKSKVQLSPSLCQTNLIVKYQKEKSPKNDRKPLSPNIKDLFVPSLAIPFKESNSDSDIKLPSEPDKQKLNILKKISKVKEETDDTKNSINEVRENSLFCLDVASRVPLLNRKNVNENNININKGFEEDMEVHVDVENSKSPSIFEFNRLPTPDLPKTPESIKPPETKKKKKDKKEKRDLDNDKDIFYNSPKSKHQIDDNFGKSKVSFTPEVSLPEEETQTAAFTALSCPVSPAPGLIPWNNPLFPNPNPTSPVMNLMSYTNFPKKPPEISTSTVQSSFSSTFTSTASHSVPAAAPSVTFPNRDIILISSKKKERKKEKKLKDKLKKKKEKKEKNRLKDKSERKKLKLEKKERAKLKIKKEKKEKKKEKEQVAEERHEVNTVPKITFKLGPVSPKDNTVEACTRKIVIKQIVKKEENENPETVPFMAEIPKAITNSSIPKLKSLKGGKSHFQIKPEVVEKPSSFSCAPILSIPKAEPVSSITKWDGDTNQLWICPACNRPDDGSPMIACDRCDYWYHWTCVGIQEAIESDWYCESCISRREEVGSEKKKKHRKKKA